MTLDHFPLDHLQCTQYVYKKSENCVEIIQELLKDCKELEGKRANSSKLGQSSGYGKTTPKSSGGRRQ